MELKSLFLGLIFSMGIFAVKSGAGLSYLLRREPKLRLQLAASLAFMACYALLFWLAWILVNRLNFLAHLDTVMLFFKNGMSLHFLLAILLAFWGVALLKKDSGAGDKKSHAWLLLSLPCPVCFSVILFSGSFLQAMLPDVEWLFAWLFAGFISVSLLSGLCLAFFHKGNAEHGLGTIMVLAALYFLLTIALVPQFSDVERIYRLSLGSDTTLANKQLPLLLMGMGLVFGVGFIKSLPLVNRKKARISTFTK